MSSFMTPSPTSRSAFGSSPSRTSLSPVSTTLKRKTSRLFRIGLSKIFPSSVSEPVNLGDFTDAPRAVGSGSVLLSRGQGSLPPSPSKIDINSISPPTLLPSLAVSPPIACYPLHLSHSIAILHFESPRAAPPTPPKSTPSSSPKSTSKAKSIEDLASRLSTLSSPSGKGVPMVLGEDGHLRGLTDFGDCLEARKGAGLERRKTTATRMEPTAPLTVPVRRRPTLPHFSTRISIKPRSPPRTPPSPSETPYFSHPTFSPRSSPRPFSASFPSSRSRPTTPPTPLTAHIARLQALNALIVDAWSPAGERPASPSSSFFSGETDEDEEVEGVVGKEERQEAETPEGGNSPVVVLGGLEGEGESGVKGMVGEGEGRKVKKVGSRREGFF